MSTTMRYSPPHTRYGDLHDHIRLDDNTLAYPAPIPWSEKDLQSLASTVHRYPGDDRELRSRIAQLYGVQSENVLCAAGSSEVLRLLLLTYAKGKNVLTMHPTFGLYRQIADEVGAKMKHVCVDEQWDVDKNAWMSSRADSDVQIICHPNNPTGRYASSDDMSEMTEGFDGISIIDEAYGPIADADAVYASRMRHAPGYENQLVVRSFKALGAANIRVGYAVGSASAIDDVRSRQIPFGISDLQQVIACGVLENLNCIRANINSVIQERERVRTALQNLGLRVIPSSANFLLFQESPGKCAAHIHHELLENGVIIRQFNDGHLSLNSAEVNKQPQIKNMLRVTIGTPEQNNTFISAMQRII